MSNRGRRARPWLLSWAALTLLGCIWAVSTPVFGAPDEPAHVIYSAAAVRGQLWAPTDGIVTTVELPAEYAAAHLVPVCYTFQPSRAADCAPAFQEVPGTADATTTAGRYPPAYYLYVGIGSLVASGANAVYVMRLLTAAAVAAFLASAACSVLKQGNRRTGMAALALSTTPMLFFFAGSVNPQSIEIAAAILLWTSGVGLLKSIRDSADVVVPGADVRRVIVAALSLTLIRPLSLLWLAIIVLALLVSTGSWEAVRRLLRTRIVLLSLPLLVLAAGSTGVWILLRDALAQQDVTIYAGLPRADAVRISASKLNDEFMQMIGYFGWLDSPAPGIVYILFPTLLGALAAVTLERITRRQKAVIMVLVGLVVVIPIVLELTSYEVSAFAWQGRYTLPIAVGVPLLLGLLPSRDLQTEAGHPGAFLPTILFSVGAIHAVAFIGALGRNVFGIDGLWGVTPALWSPPIPTWAVIAAAVALLLVAASLAWIAARNEPASPTESATESDKYVKDRSPKERQ